MSRNTASPSRRVSRRASAARRALAIHRPSSTASCSRWARTVSSGTAATSVEDALLHALADPTEMNAEPTAIVDKLTGIEGYRLQFECLYGDVSWDAIGDAIGAPCIPPPTCTTAAWPRWPMSSTGMPAPARPIATSTTATVGLSARRSPGRTAMTSLGIRVPSLQCRAVTHATLCRGHGTSLTVHEAAFGGIEQSLAELERLVASYPSSTTP